MNRFIYRRLNCAFNTSHNLTEFFFHVGYQGFSLPKSLRSLFAKSKWHRAWHSGFFGGGILSIIERHEIRGKSRGQ